MPVTPRGRGPAPDAWAEISRSHHTVYSDGHTWAKVAREASAAARREIATDAAVLGRLGVDVALRSCGDRLVHFTPTLGEKCPPERFDPYVVIGKLARYWSAITPESGLDLPRVELLVDSVEAKIRARVSDPGDQQYLLNALPNPPSRPSRTKPMGLCHTDPHAGNWLTGADGLVLIDWESAMYGPAYVDEACVAWTLWMLGRQAEAAHFMPAHDSAAEVVLAKSISAASWAWQRLGREAMLERVRAGQVLACAARTW